MVLSMVLQKYQNELNIGSNIFYHIPITRIFLQIMKCRRLILIILKFSSHRRSCTIQTHYYEFISLSKHLHQFKLLNIYSLSNFYIKMFKKVIRLTYPGIKTCGFRKPVATQDTRLK